MSEEKERREEETSEKMPVEIFVGRELGSTGPIQARDETDSRMYSLLSPPEILALSWFSLVPKLEGGDYARAFCEEYRRHGMSKEGWRANAMIRLVAGSKGVSSAPVTRKPGIIGRNITQRDWEKKAEREGATIV